VPWVGEAAVTVVDTGDGERQLAAYVVARADASERDPSALREVLRGKLPEYMIPAYFVRLDSLPVTANGKIDRRALPMPDMTRGERGYIAPDTPVEHLLADIWARVLKLDRVGTGDNFFELGGHSLSATQVVSEIKAQMQMELPLRTFFEYPTIGALAPVIEAMIVEHIQGMSDEEAERLLQEETGEPAQR
jgi:acyl carrier protein